MCTCRSTCFLAAHSMHVKSVLESTKLSPWHSASQLLLIVCEMDCLQSVVGWVEVQGLLGWWLEWHVPGSSELHTARVRSKTDLFSYSVINTCTVAKHSSICNVLDRQRSWHRNKVFAPNFDKHSVPSWNLPNFYSHKPRPYFTILPAKYMMTAKE